MIEPPPFFQHCGQERLDGAMHGFDVEVEREVPVLLRTFQHRALVHIAGNVGEHIECAEFLVDRSGKGIDRCARQHVELGGFCGFQAVKLVSRDIGRDDARAFSDEGLGDRAADTLASGGDQRQLSFQSVAHGNIASQWLSRATPFWATR